MKFFFSARHAMGWLRKPTSWPEAARRVRQAGQGRRWCAARAVGLGDGFSALSLRPPQTSFEDAHEGTVREALERISGCPTRLGGGGNMTLLYWLCEELEASRVLETGVAYGWSSLAILTSMRERENGLLCSTDMPYPHLAEGERECVGAAVPESLRGSWCLLRQPDEDGLDEALCRLGIIDLAHHDSDKSYEGRVWAYPRLWRALRPGGVLVADDVGDNLAFRDFTASQGIEPVVVGNGSKFQGLVKK